MTSYLLIEPYIAKQESRGRQLLDIAVILQNVVEHKISQFPISKRTMETNGIKALKVFVAGLTLREARRGSPEWQTSDI
jgi:hypothetical protein